MVMRDGGFTTEEIPCTLGGIDLATKRVFSTSRQVKERNLQDILARESKGVPPTPLPAAEIQGDYCLTTITDPRMRAPRKSL